MEITGNGLFGLLESCVGHTAHGHQPQILWVGLRLVVRGIWHDTVPTFYENRSHGYVGRAMSTYPWLLFYTRSIELLVHSLGTCALSSGKTLWNDAL